MGFGADHFYDGRWTSFALTVGSRLTIADVREADGSTVSKESAGLGRRFFAMSPTWSRLEPPRVGSNKR